MSASIHLSEKLIKYCRAFKSALIDAANLAKEVTAVGQALQTLRGSIENPPRGLSFPKTSSLSASIRNYERRMQALEASLVPHASRFRNLLKRAKWPLR